MSEEVRKERRARIREVIEDAKHITKKEFPMYAETSQDFRITVLSIANMIVQDGRAGED